MTRSRVLHHAGYWAAGFGAAAGVLQLTGAQPALTGNKNDPVVLGFVTLGLATIMALGVWMSGRTESTGPALASSAALGVPALLGLSTAGSAWIPAALLGLTASLGTLGVATHRGSVWETLDEFWPCVLLFVLAMVYITLGITESGWIGLVGLAGGLSVLTSLLFRAGDPWLSTCWLLVGAIPFAVITAWTGISVATAVLMLMVGLPGLVRPRLNRAARELAS